MTYEERIRELSEYLQPGDDEEGGRSALYSNAQADWKTLFEGNAAILGQRWNIDPHAAAEVIASVAAILRGILLQSGGGIEAVGRIEDINDEPCFEVVLSPSATLGTSPTEQDARVQVSAAEIALEMANHVGRGPEDAVELWKCMAVACREWANTPEATPLLPNLTLHLDNSGVRVTLEHVEYGLG